MTESFLSDTDAKALSGTSLAPSGVPVPSTDEQEWHGPANKFLDRLNRALDVPTACQVFAEVGLTTFGVRAGSFIDNRNGQMVVAYAGATAQALTASQTNYIYLTPAAVLTVNTSGFPATDHYPLGSIVAIAGSAYTLDSITDYRDRAIFQTVDANPGGRFGVREDFNQAGVADLPAPWAVDTQNGGTADHVANAAAGIFQLALTATSEAQASQITWGDHLSIDTDKSPIVEYLVTVDGANDLTSVEKIVIGLSQIHANAEDSLDGMTHSVWFMLKGAADLKIYQEADDGVTDTNDIDTGIVIVDDTPTLLRIDMTNLAAVKMFVDGVQTSTTLDMTASFGETLQPIMVAARTDNSQVEVGFQVEVDLVDVAAER